MPLVPVGVNFELPDDIHRRARSRAAMRGQKFYAYLIEKIAQGVERDEAEDQATPGR